MKTYQLTNILQADAAGSTYDGVRMHRYAVRRTRTSELREDEQGGSSIVRRDGVAAQLA